VKQFLVFIANIYHILYKTEFASVTFAHFECQSCYLPHCKHAA